MNGVVGTWLGEVMYVEPALGHVLPLELAIIMSHAPDTRSSVRMRHAIMADRVAVLPWTIRNHIALGGWTLRSIANRSAEWHSW
jgi:hypothetical protein